MTEDLLTTVEAAHLAGVTPSSIKRWADQGLLPCVRTVGGHRRYERIAVDQFLRAQSGSGQTDYLRSWIERLVTARQHEVEGALLEARARLGAWHRVAVEIGGVITELGRSWEFGRISIAEEHIASECLSRALAHIAESLPGRTNGPRGLLACAEDDDHTLGLSLVDLCLRESGWTSVWLGRRTPTPEIVQIVQDGGARLVALSASSYSTDASRLAAAAIQVGKACRQRAVSLVLGGSGAWPQSPVHGVRQESFSDFHSHLARLELIG